MKSDSDNTIGSVNEIHLVFTVLILRGSTGAQGF